VSPRGRRASWPRPDELFTAVEGLCGLGFACVIRPRASSLGRPVPPGIHRAAL